MNKLDYLKTAIETLRKMERDGKTPAELCNEFDRFVREQIFGKFNLELPAEEIIALQDYYVATL